MSSLIEEKLFQKGNTHVKIAEITGQGIVISKRKKIHFHYEKIADTEQEALQGVVELFGKMRHLYKSISDCKLKVYNAQRTIDDTIQRPIFPCEKMDGLIVFKLTNVLEK